MDYKKIGQFIKILRENNNMTQDELADLIPIGRTAISKWENGNSIPDPSVLIKLSEIFNVSINEILFGQKNEKSKFLNSNFITLELYKNLFKKNKIIKYLLCIILVILLIFLSYYFLTSFKTTKIYNVTGFGENFEINNGIAIYTNKKYYFYIGNIISKDDLKIKKLELFIKYKNEDLKLLDSQENEYLFLMDLKGYNEFNIKNYIDDDYKTYIKIYFNDSSELIELNYNMDFINDYIIPKSVSDAVSNHKNNIEGDSKLIKENNALIEKIKNTLINEKDYSYQNIIYNNGILNITYNDLNNSLSLIYEVDGNVVESWNYNFDLKSLGYTNEETSYLIVSEEMQCLYGKCQNWKQKNNEFWEIINMQIG